MGANKNKNILVLFSVLAIVLLSASSFSITTLEVEETDLVKLVSEVVDWDDDEVMVVYSSPLNESGEWQTDYGDAGEYKVIIAATDGKSITEEEVLLIVKKKNRAPEIEVEDLTVDEGELAEIKPEITDPDGDLVRVTFGEPFDDEGFWQTGYDDAGEYDVSITASDGAVEVTRAVAVLVNNVNRKPEIDNYYPRDSRITIKENEEIEFGIEASDPDGDSIDYACKLNGETIAVENNCRYKTDYNSAGDYDLEISASDGENEAKRTWNLKVDNINRAPVLGDFDEITVDEGDKVMIELPTVDADGEILTYAIGEPIGDDKEWQTGYDDAGEYEVDVLISDGELEDEGTIKIIVNDVDRAPVFDKLSSVEMMENEEVKIDLKAVDPDGDEVYFSAFGFPEGAVWEDNTIIWNPGYDFVSRPDNLARRVLDRLHLSNLVFGSERILSVDLEVCGKEKCAEQSLDIKVADVNRPPVLGEMPEIEMNETDKVKIKPTAVDPDGDRVKFYFSAPLDKDGTWQTGYNDSGFYEAVIGATDGKESVEEAISLTVNNNNRMPSMERIADRKVNENETVWIKVVAADPDAEDELTAWVEEGPEDASFSDGLFKWTPGFGTVTEQKDDFFHNFISNFAFLNRKMSQEKVVLTPAFAVSDGDYVVSKLVNIVVRNWNRAPEIVNATPEKIEVYVGEPVLFEVEAIDLDGDALDYEWELGSWQGEVKNANRILRTFTSTGQKKVTLSISDGRDVTEKTWQIDVKPKVVERKAPVQEEQPQPRFVTYVVEG